MMVQDLEDKRLKIKDRRQKEINQHEGILRYVRTACILATEEEVLQMLLPDLQALQ